MQENLSGGPVADADQPQHEPSDIVSQSTLQSNAALTYARKGWRVFPLYEPHGSGCSCGNPECGKPGKHPRIKDWQHFNV
jgi:hypothetical protein